MWNLDRRKIFSTYFLKTISAYCSAKMFLWSREILMKVKSLFEHKPFTFSYNFTKVFATLMWHWHRELRIGNNEVAVIIHRTNSVHTFFYINWFRRQWNCCEMLSLTLCFQIILVRCFISSVYKIVSRASNGITKGNEWKQFKIIKRRKEK